MSNQTPSPNDPLYAIAAGAANESPLWEAALRPESEREQHLVFSALLTDPRYALGFETIYEGYLLHYGRSRLFVPPDLDVALLLGDTLLAHGLVRVAEAGEVIAVEHLARLLSLCAQLRADARPGDDAAWAVTAAALGRSEVIGAHEAVLAGDCGPALALARACAGTEAVDQALMLHHTQTAVPVL